MKEPVVRFSQSVRGQQRLDTRVNTQPVIRTAFGLIKKRISGRI